MAELVGSGFRPTNPLPTVCLGCSLLCDDLQPGPDTAPADWVHQCAQGTAWLHDCLAKVETTTTPPQTVHAATGTDESKPIWHVRGMAVTESMARATGLQLLQSAQSILVLAGTGLSTEQQQYAIRWAQRWEAALALAEPIGLPPLAIQRDVGLVTCSLGEIRQRADMLVLWNCQPDQTHPRLLERIGLWRQPPTPWPPLARTVYQLHTGPVERVHEPNAVPEPIWTPFHELVPATSAMSTNSTQPTTYRLNLSASDPLTVLRQLRWQLFPPNAPITTPPNTPEFAQDANWQSFCQHLTSCRYGVFITSLPEQTFEAQLVWQELLRLTSDLNDKTRWRLFPLVMELNLLGWEQCQLWQTGHLGPLLGKTASQCTANELIEQHLTDLVVCLEPPPRVICDLLRDRQISTILFQSPIQSQQTIDFEPTVSIRVQAAGVAESGTFFRTDDIPLFVPAWQTSPFPSLIDILRHWDAAKSQASGLDNAKISAKAAATVT